MLAEWPRGCAGGLFIIGAVAVWSSSSGLHLPRVFVRYMSCSELPGRVLLVRLAQNLFEEDL